MNFTGLPRGSLFALMLIIAGALLFLDNLGVLPIQNIGAYWPVFIIIWGASVFERRRSPVATICALALVAWGTLLILGNLQILHVTGSVFWPVVLIAFGVSMLVSPLDFNEWRARVRLKAAEHRRVRFSHSNPHGDSESYFGNQLHESRVFSTLNRRVETQNFEGGKLEIVFGSIELDLSGASISSPERQARMKVDAVFGGVEIIVPRTWRIIMKATAVFGGCVDQTVPPRPEPGLEPVTLVIAGGAVFGGISVRN